jgi:hypothetical protein
MRLRENVDAHNSTVELWVRRLDQLIVGVLLQNGKYRGWMVVVSAQVDVRIKML